MAAILVFKGLCAKQSDAAAGRCPEKIISLAFSDHFFSLRHQFLELRLLRSARRIELFRTGARDHSNHIGSRSRALIHERFDATEAVSYENKSPIAFSDQMLERAIKIFCALFESFVGGAAELGQIACPRNPVVAAGVDDKTMIAALGQHLTEIRQRRQIEVHCYAVNHDKR